MRKTLKTIFVLVLALALCCNAAFASSKTDVEEIKATDEYGNPVHATASESSSKISTANASKIVKSSGKGTGKTDAGDLTVVSVKDVEADTYPATMTFDVGADVPTYVLVQKGNEWVLVDVSKDGKVTVTIDGPTTIALVTGEPKDSGSGSGSGSGSSSGKSGKSGSSSGKSYKTGEESVILGCGTVALAAGVIALVARKKEA